MKPNRRPFARDCSEDHIVPGNGAFAALVLLVVAVLLMPGPASALPASAGRRQVLVLVVGYDREVCNEYGQNCRDSELSSAFQATGDTLEDSLSVPALYRVDVKELQLKWLDADKKTRETAGQALLRTLRETGAAITRDNGRVSALIFVGHGVRGGRIGPTYDGGLVNLLDLAQQVGLADRGVIVALACSVAERMDLSPARAQGYRVFATAENIDWLDNGMVKLWSQPQSQYRPANDFRLPEQTRYLGSDPSGLPRTAGTALRVEGILLQALGRGRDSLSH